MALSLTIGLFLVASTDNSMSTHNKKSASKSVFIITVLSFFIKVKLMGKLNPANGILLYFDGLFYYQ